MRGKRRTWTDQQLAEAVARRFNFSDVLRELGLRPAGGNHANVKRHVTRLGLDTSHFNNDGRLRGLRLYYVRRRLHPDDVFCEQSRVNSSVLRRYALRHATDVRCALCANVGEWRGRPLTLQLDHVNGRYNDNRLENLRWLCPNCHSQTPTFAGRGSVRRVREAPPVHYRRGPRMPHPPRRA